MFDKYEVRSYPNYFQMEYSDSDTEKFNSTFKKRKNNHINQNNNSDNIFHQELKEKDNIFNYLTNSKDTYQGGLYENINQEIKPDFKFNKQKKNSIPSQNYIEQNFSYNYNGSKNLNNTNSFKKRIYLDRYLNKTNNKVSKKMINSIQNKFDIERSENFKVLSNKPDDYESDNMKMKGKSEIIHFSKKQKVGKDLTPGKRDQSPSSSINSITKEQQLYSHQAPGLKFQSFFGFFTKPIHSKNKSQTKSNSKLKKNQLEDFNIDKLIEIGDSFENNNMKNIMSFGKKITSIKNKMKKRKFINNFHDDNIEKSYDGIKNEINRVVHTEKKVNENNAINEKKLTSTKKIVYHGQIRRKKNIIKNSKTFNNIQDKEQINYNNNNENNKVTNTIINTEKKDLNDNIYTKINNFYSKMKRRTVMPNHNGIDFFNNENKIYHENTPNRIIKKRKMGLILNSNKSNISISNKKYNNRDIILEKNKLFNNSTTINNENIRQGNLSKKILLSEQKMSNKNNDEKINEKNQNLKKWVKNKEDSNYKKYKKIDYTNKQITKKNPEENLISKNYYGYDDRNNLEGAINNHSYFESIYSRKK